MSGWLERLSAVEELEDAPLDAALVAEFERGASAAVAREIRFSTPTFKSYSSCEVSGCGKNAFPAFSVTAGACGLDCDHCQAKILEPMIPATNPAMLEAKVRDMIAHEDLRGFLLSGGSNRRNEIPYERYMPVIERLKREFPFLKVAIHSALTDARRAKSMESAGVDTAMMDVIGADETIREVYHLDRPVEDFEATLEALCATSMEVVPHIVIGLHYGRILGEPRALDIVARHGIHSLVLVVVMPFYAKPGTFATPDTSDVGRIFLEARRRIADREVLLGCARPPGMHRRVTDAYAVAAGLDGIAFPADGMLAVAGALGRPVVQEHACCSIKTGRTIKIHPRTAIAAP
ncbi:MAG TPA: radical SAM protein [Usitatibacter sp.]